MRDDQCRLFKSCLWDLMCIFNIFLCRYSDAAHLGFYFELWKWFDLNPCLVMFGKDVLEKRRSRIRNNNLFSVSDVPFKSLNLDIVSLNIAWRLSKTGVLKMRRHFVKAYLFSEKILYHLHSESSVWYQNRVKKWIFHFLDSKPDNRTHQEIYVM